MLTFVGNPKIDFARVAADFNINPAAARMRWSRLKKSINVDDIASSDLSAKQRSKTRATTRQAKPQPTEPELRVLPKTENALPIPRLSSPILEPPGLSPGKTGEDRASFATAPGSASLTESFHATQTHHPPGLPEPAPSPLPVLPPPANTLKSTGSQGLSKNTDPGREPPTRGLLGATIVKPMPESPSIKPEPAADTVAPVKRERSPVRGTRSTSGTGTKSGTAGGTSGRTKRVKVAAGEDE